MNVSEWAGRTDFSDFLFGKERWIVWEIFPEQLQDIIKPINETISANCWHIWKKNGRKETLWSQVELPAIQLFSWCAFFSAHQIGKNICKGRARQIRSMSSKIRVFSTKTWFRTTKSYIPICAQQPSHVLFKMLMASSAVSQSHVTKPLLGTKTRAIRVGRASLVSFWDGGGQKSTQTAFEEEWMDAM